MLLELDFENEARNIEEFARNHEGRPYVVIPKLYGDLSSRTVITLQELKGVKLKTVLESGESAGIDRKQLARNVLEASFQQLFCDGLFHGDPPPGKVLVMGATRH